MAAITSILLVFIFLELTSYLKIIMYSINTCSINTATEIFKQKYVPDPLTQENFCPTYGCINGLLPDITANVGWLVILTQTGYN